MVSAASSAVYRFGFVKLRRKSDNLGGFFATMMLCGDNARGDQWRVVKGWRCLGLFPGLDIYLEAMPERSCANRQSD